MYTPSNIENPGLAEGVIFRFPGSFQGSSSFLLQGWTCSRYLMGKIMAGAKDFMQIISRRITLERQG